MGASRAIKNTPEVDVVEKTKVLAWRKPSVASREMFEGLGATLARVLEVNVFLSYRYLESVFAAQCFCLLLAKEK